MAKKAAAIEPTIIKERKAAAGALEITDRSLGNWRKLDGFPDCSGGYDIELIKAWRDEHERKGSVADEALVAINREIKKEQLLKYKEANRMAALERETAEGTLLRRDLYERFCASLLSGISDWCDQLPGLIESALPAKHGKAARERLTVELKRMRNQLAEDLKRVPVDG